MRKQLVLGALAALSLTMPARADRPTMSALRVPDGAIKIDGHLDDWPAASGGAPYQASANSADHVLHTRPENGPWSGPADLSATVRAAHDAKFLYLAVQVKDQLWFNAGGSEFPWAGDAVEVYLDANPIASQFQKGTNLNFAQFIFVPDHIYEAGDGIFIWRADKFPGVVAASRLTPVGYTMEVAIPKSVVPNWAANPDLASIGFGLGGSARDIRRFCL